MNNFIYNSISFKEKVRFLQGIQLQQFIINQLDYGKAKEIISINVHGKSSITDKMIICTGTSNRHLISIANRLTDACRKNNLQFLGIEGQGVSDWIVVDLGEAIVHIMQDESRRMYELEKLWS
ncbi:Ribosomal silencing factor RsfS [Candidatus Hartigia pinicola]|nr:Ribosomal silencing factor RsfS [Candidatus Hartigia pinicola]